MWGLLFPYGVILQAIAIVHFIRSRPDRYWLWIILMGGGVGALAYLAIEAGPDLLNIHHSFRFLSRNKRINELRMVILDNPAPGNYEELADLYREAGNFAAARQCYDQAISTRTASPHPFYGRALALLEQRGSISVERRIGRSNRYRLTLPVGLPLGCAGRARALS